VIVNYHPVCCAASNTIIVSRDDHGGEWPVRIEDCLSYGTTIRKNTSPKKRKDSKLIPDGTLQTQAHAVGRIAHARISNRSKSCKSSIRSATVWRTRSNLHMH
jgi:hypothetical protein